MARTRFLNDPEDVKWLKDTHLRNVRGVVAFRSFMLVGNEDYPEAVFLYASKDPRHDDAPVRVVSGAEMHQENPPVRRIGAYVHNFWSADRYLGGKQERKLANNTVVVRRGADSIAVRLHHTDIVTYFLDGRIQLRSGGWETTTTKQRMNELLPPGYGVFAKKHRWYVSGPMGDVPFEDGMIARQAREDDDTNQIMRRGVEEYKGRGYDSNPSRRKYLRLGSISEGTLRPEDIIPAMLHELESFGGRRKYPVLFRECDEVLAALDEDEEPDADPSELVDELYNALEEHAPPYTYVGASEGDGASIGVWVSEDAVREGVASGEILVQDDGHRGRQDAIPKSYTGYVLHVSDHGNQSLYEYKRGRNVGDVW